MSFSGSIVCNKNDISKLSVTPQQVPPSNDSEAMIEVAKRAAVLLATKVGIDEDRISVSISGHANTNHGPTEGWGDEFITVTVGVNNRG